MSSVKVEFLRAKRYPHPSGPKRNTGDRVQMPANLAQQWASAGIVKLLEPKEAPGAASTEDAARALVNTNLTKLREALAATADVSVVREAQERDDRKGAQDMYAERLKELS